MKDRAIPSIKKDRPGWRWSYAISFVLQFLLACSVYGLLKARNFNVPPIFYWLIIVSAFSTVILMALGMIKKNISYVWWEALLLVFAFLGIWLLCLAVLPAGWALMFAGAITLLPYLWPLTVWHDLSFILGSTGLGLFFALQFPFTVLLICGSGVVVYEALRFSRIQMSALLSEAFDVGIPPGILLPVDMKGWFRPLATVWRAGQGMVIGLLPYVFMAAISLRLLHKGWFWIALMAVVSLLVCVIWGEDKERRVRSWIILAIAVGFYALSGLIDL